MSALPDRPPVWNAAEADGVLARLGASLETLQAAMEEETRLLAAGRLREGLAGENRKAELAAEYMVALRHAKANIVALARLAPEPLKRFRVAQSRFESVIDRNQTVIATARAVSEGLIRGLAAEVEREARPAAYGPVPPARPPAASPLVFSGRF